MKKTVAYLLLAVMTSCGLSLQDMDRAAQTSPQSSPITVHANWTSSTWVGTNLSADITFVDITRMLNAFNTSANELDSNGYPIAGASGGSSTDVGWALPTGNYNISYVGTGTLAVSGIGKLTGAWQSVNGEMRNVVAITGTPGAFGNFLNLTITNQPGQTVTQIHLYVPGEAYDTADIFMPQFLTLLHPFSTLRFMDWMNTNGSTLVNWAQRPALSSYGLSAYGLPYEGIYLLANLTGKDLWINIPEHATDDFVTNLADFLRDNLNFAQIASLRKEQGLTTPFQIYVEYSNETWNGGFTAYNTLLTVANSKPTRYLGNYNNAYPPSWMGESNALMQVGQVEADLLVHTTQIMRKEFSAVGQSAVIAPILSGWALGPAYSDDALQFINDYWGPPAQFIAGVAIAPYFSVSDSDCTSLDSLFTALDAGIQSDASTFAEFKQLVNQYGIQMFSYEGGQGISGDNDLPIKHLAQQDVRMYQAYNQFFQVWQAAFGKSTFMHFSLAGSLNIPEFIRQYGFWDSIGSVYLDPTQCGQNLPTLLGTESVSSVAKTCPKYQALQEQAGQ